VRTLWAGRSILYFDRMTDDPQVELFKFFLPAILETSEPLAVCDGVLNVDNYLYKVVFI
jgi:hypothetical protein